MIQPVEYKVLIELDVLEEKTSMGIIIPANRLERDQMAQTRATLIAVGGNAFEDWGDPKPKVGDRVLVQKYAGERPDRLQKGSHAEDLCETCTGEDAPYPRGKSRNTGIEKKVK